MKKLHILSGIVFLIGVACLLIGALQGQLRGGMILLFPFVIGSGLYAVAGFLLLSLAFFLVLLGFTRNTADNEDMLRDQNRSEQKPTIKGGGIVLVGPIPIVIGSSWKIALALILTTIFLIALVFFLFYKG